MAVSVKRLSLVCHQTEGSVMAVVEPQGPFGAGRSPQRPKALSGCSGGVIKPNGLGLWPGQPSPALSSPLP